MLLSLMLLIILFYHEIQRIIFSRMSLASASSPLTSPPYTCFSLIIPSGFITVVTIIGFFTPSSSTGENTEKVSLGVTALLSMAIIMMMVADEIPATSDVMPLIGEGYCSVIGYCSPTEYCIVTKSCNFRQVLHWPNLHIIPGGHFDNNDIVHPNAWNKWRSPM